MPSFKEFIKDVDSPPLSLVRWVVHIVFLRMSAVCPICLGQIEHLTKLDPCFHAFCFNCITQWAKVSARCPLCVRPIVAFLHDIDLASRSFKRILVPLSSFLGKFF